MDDRSEREAERVLRSRRAKRIAAVVAIASGLVLAVLLITGGGDEVVGSDVAGVSESEAMLEGIPQDGTILGDAGAPVVMTEFADLQCQACAEYATSVLPRIIEDHVRTGRLRLDLNLLRIIGPDSDRGARAAHAAAERDAVWNFVDLWYRNQGTEGTGYAGDDFIASIADAAGLSGDDIVAAIADPVNERPIVEAEQAAQTLGIDSTPSFAVAEGDGEPVVLDVEALTPEAFTAALAPYLE